MDSRILKRAGIFISALLILFSTNLLCSDNQGLLEKVKNLKIGLNGYFIGNRLNKIQLKTLKKNKSKKSYTNTIKFKDKELYITVSENFTILGIYKRIVNGSFDDFKKTISFLMMKFGEPTVEAHDKTVYWLYNEKGKITDTTYQSLKNKNRFNEFKPLVMVKFNSNSLISEIKQDKKGKYTFYYIIYSEPLIKETIRTN